jgi:hypothetical protein
MWSGVNQFSHPNQIILGSLEGKQVPPSQPLESPLVRKCKQNLVKKVGAEIREPRVVWSEYFLIVSRSSTIFLISWTSPGSYLMGTFKKNNVASQYWADP